MAINLDFGLLENFFKKSIDLSCFEIDEISLILIVHRVVLLSA